MENQELHIARGDAATNLLTNDGFMAVTNEIVNLYVGQIVGSGPEDTKGRERAYAGIKAVQDIVGVLNQWKGIAEQIRTPANDDTNYEDNE